MQTLIPISAASTKITVTTAALKLFDLMDTAGSVKYNQAYYMTQCVNCPANAVLITPEGGSIRVLTGVNPTASQGTLLAAGTTYCLPNINPSDLRLISTTGGSVLVSVEPGKSSPEESFSAVAASFTGDIEIGAVEIKNATTDDRANVSAANTGRSATDKVLLVQTIDASGNVGSSSTSLRADFEPGYNGVAAQPQAQSTVDGDSSLRVRALALTDEGSFRENFSGSLIYVACGTGFVFTNASTAVVSDAAFGTYDIHVGDYIKLSTDTEASYAQIASIVGTAITLVSAYTGTGGTGICWCSIMKPTTGSGGTIAVASGVCTLSSGTTNSAVTKLERLVDWMPVNCHKTFSISQRIANQDVYSGLIDSAATPKFFARFHFTGTNNTQVICETGQSRSGAPSASEQQAQTVTLPNSLTTATSNKYRIELLPDAAVFYVNDVELARNYSSLPRPYDVLESYISIVNGTGAAGSTDVVITDILGRNYNSFDTIKPQKLGVGQVNTSGTRVDFQADANNATQINSLTKIAGEDLTYDVMKTQVQMSATDISASASIKSGAGQCTGFIVNSSTNTATLKLWDNTAGSGTVLLGTMTFTTQTAPVIYTFPCAMKFATGLYATIAVAALDVTLLWN